MKRFKDMKKLFESVFYYATDGIVILDLQATIIDVNPAFERMTGWSKQELLNKRQPLSPPGEIANIMRCYHEVASGMTPCAEYKGKKIRKDGSYFDIMATLSPIMDDDDSVIAVTQIVKDITSLIKAQELSVQAEKLSVIGELAAGIAHEIRNPLTSLQGFIKLLSHQLNNSLYVSIMEKELHSIEQIANEFLVLAKPHVTDLKLYNPFKLLHHVIELMKVQTNMYNIEMITALSDSIVFVTCNENELKQVFLNIVKNAIEAMPNGGRLYIQTRLTTQTAEIIVRDNGHGIPREDLKKVGSPFFTTKPEGTGLGILVSKRIIKMYNGDLDISSQVGKGTTVKITLPKAGEAQLG